MDDENTDAQFEEIISRLEENSDNEADYWAIREWYEARSFFLRAIAVGLVIGIFGLVGLGLILVAVLALR